MHKAAALFSLAVALLGSAAAQTKMGVVNTQLAVIGTAEFKQWRATAETKFKPRQEQIAQLAKQLQDIQAQLQGGKLSGQAEADLQAQAQQKQRQGQRMQQDYQEDVDREQNDALQRIGQRMKDVVQKLADARGLDVVADAANIVFFKPALDLTNEAIAAYDKAYPVK